MRYLPAFCLGTVGAFLLPSSIYEIGVGWLALLVSITLIGLYFRKLWLLVFFFGVIYSVFRTTLSLQTNVSNKLNNFQRVALNIEVNSLSVQKPSFQQLKVKVISRGFPFKYLILRDFSHQDWELGSRWRIKANIHSVIARVNAAGFNSEAWALAQGIDGYATFQGTRIRLPEASFVSKPNYWIERGRAQILRRIRSYQKAYPEGSALVSSLVLGYRGDLASQQLEDFSRLGLSHLISISGLHIGLIALAIGSVLTSIVKRLIKWKGITWFPFTPLTTLSVATALAALGYALLSGFSVPAQRSFLMIAIVTYSILCRKYKSPWQVWWLALSAVLAVSPMNALSIGFWLSFWLVASLLWVRYVRLAGPYQTYLLNFFRAEAATTIASVIPVSVIFNKLALGSFLANLLVIPWFSFILVPLAFLAALLPVDFLLHLAVSLAEATLKFIHLLAEELPVRIIPQLPLVWVGLGLLASIILILPRGLGLKAWASLVFLAIFLFKPVRLASKEIHLIVFDVGQGLSLLLETRHHRLLYDTGPLSVKQDLLANLYSKGITKLDMLILSHHDADHDANWKTVLKALSVPLVIAGQPHAYLGRAQLCETGKAWEWDGEHFEFLTLQGFLKARPKNDQSCILRIVVGREAILIPGDLSQHGELELVERYQTAIHSTVLILGHHGSKTSTSQYFLDYVSPEVAISSSGYQNAFHHPDPTVLAALQKRKIRLFRTDLEGAIEINIGQTRNIHPVLQIKPYWQKKPM
ncbi:MAG: DNA internalization-related competence protein ComEC/Rec2 [Neisseriaceae bacterium]